MTKVYENAIYVLRAMEALNLHVGLSDASEATIQAFVRLQDSEFDPVMHYLYQNHLVTGRGNKHAGACWLTAAGIDKIENVTRNKVSISFNAERLLRYIVSAEPSHGYHDVRGTSFADVKDSMDIERSEYDHLVVELHDLGFIESAVRNASHITDWDVRPTPKGRMAIRNGFQLSQNETSSDSLTPSRTSVVQKDVPSQITDSLAKFRGDHPESERTAFIMMRFRETNQYRQITEVIRSTLSKFGISGLRADDKEYHRDQWTNIETYMIGCTFGIAVFEQIQIEDAQFNPNIALEVGYMMAVQKEICLLKDRHIAQLPSDLLGKLYRPFDTYSIEATLPPVLQNWIRDKGFDAVNGM